jgi:ABC-type taurine transport system ATPase subunit
MRNILKAILVISAVSAGFSAHAQGSMAPEVRIIEVVPSRSILIFNEQHKAAKRAQKLENWRFNKRLRDMERAEREYHRERKKEMERWMKEMDKKMHRERFKPKKRW